MAEKKDKPAVVTGPELSGSAQLRLVPDPIAESPLVYSNFAQVSASPHDFTFHFGVYTIPVFAEQPTGIVDVPVNPVVKVTIPLNLVRALLRVLEGQADAWETNFGQELPPQPTQQREDGGGS